MNTNFFLKTEQLRRRQVDKERIRSMVESILMNADVARSIPLDEKTATVVFRELYESIRQLGDAQWWLDGYEPRNHEVSMDVLKTLDIKEKNLLNKLPRFKSIRNDANYRGYKVTLAQAKEIVEFWEKTSKDIVGKIRLKLK